MSQVAQGPSPPSEKSCGFQLLRGFALLLAPPCGCPLPTPHLLQELEEDPLEVVHVLEVEGQQVQG